MNLADHFFTFGRFKLVELTEVPRGYLEWAAKTCDLSPGLRRQIADELSIRAELAAAFRKAS